jgi:hypothetical protein
MPRHLNSYITVRKFEAGNQETGKYDDSRKPRVTEIAALDRMAFGDGEPATNAAAKLYDPEYIQCSGRCGMKKHYLEFDRTAGNAWRFHREYRCKHCRKLARLEPHFEIITGREETRLRSKANKRRKKTSLPESPARQH